MKILYHHRIRSKDGQYVHIEELTRALARLGHEIVMVGPSAVAHERFGADAGIVAQLKRYLPRFAYELMEFAYAVRDYRRLAGAIRAHRPDVLYERYNLYSPSGVWAHERFGLPMLLEVNAPLYAERKRYDGISLDRLARWTERCTWCGAIAPHGVMRSAGSRRATRCTSGCARSCASVAPSAAWSPCSCCSSMASIASAIAWVAA